MRIENLRSERNGDRARVAATVAWEDCDRPTHEVYFETVEPFADSLTCNPHAFLVGCAIPAMHYGEKRVFIDTEICPELRVGLETAMGWLRHWFYEPEQELVRIEAKTRSALPHPRTPERAGFFFSGGIDSYATLRANQLNFPREHPWSLRDALVVFGLEIDIPQAFQFVADMLQEVAQEAGLTLVPVYTNLYLNYREEDAKNHFNFWKYEHQGAVLAAIAHAFARRLTVVSIASGDDIPNIYPYGTHPLLDPNYSSIDLRIRHDGIAHSRLEKTKLVAEWDLALQHLRVCNQFRRYWPGRLNCGRCEKCVRTMLALVALGSLERTDAFPENDLTEEVVLSAVHIDYDVVHFYRELVPHLEARGRHDLARAVRRKLDEYEGRGLKLKEKVKWWDRRYLKGRLRKLTAPPSP